MLVGKEVIHEYRGRGTVMAVENGRITVRFGADYDIQKERMARAESYRRQRRGE